MFEHRQKGDYVDMISFEAVEVSGWLEKTEIFINELEKLFLSDESNSEQI